jgi:hypothetical protein
MTESYKLVTAWGKFLDWKITGGIVREFNDMIVIEHLACGTNPGSILCMIILGTELLRWKKTDGTVRNVKCFKF